MTVTYCDLCGKPAPCIRKKIDGKEFDLCGPCWDPIAEKLAGKGRAREAIPAKAQTQLLEEYDEISTY